MYSQILQTMSTFGGAASQRASEALSATPAKEL